jgi:hypothetical protein
MKDNSSVLDSMLGQILLGEITGYTANITGYGRHLKEGHAVIHVYNTADITNNCCHLKDYHATVTLHCIQHG